MSIAANKQPAQQLIWVDLEMSGLQPEQDVILEVAIIITDVDLNILHEWQPWVLHQPDSILDNMDSWNKRVHGESGLITRCQESSLSVAAAERAILKTLKKQVVKKSSPMCGNSVCQDRRFMARYMPRLEDYFHYRNLDVSSFKIAAQLYHPQIFSAVKDSKPSSHQALEDIRASIAEMQYYRRHMLVPVSE